MIKKVNITFDYDTELDVIKNLKCEAESQVKRKKAIKKDDEEPAIEDEARVILEENKLIINNKAQLDMGLNVGDRILVVWNKEGKLLLPYIGTDEMLDQEGGNKLTKSGTVSYRGAQNAVLADYGTEFTIKLEKEKWRLIPLNAVIKTQEEEKAEEAEAIALADYVALEVAEGDDNYEIDNNKFTL
jgi:hypothetical protein